MKGDFNYQRYLASREWALLKQKVRERSGGLCERCELLPMTATHHLTYERLGGEALEDLQGVCRPCHRFESGVSDFDMRAWALDLIELTIAHIKADFPTEGFHTIGQQMRAFVNETAPYVSTQDQSNAADYLGSAFYYLGRPQRFSDPRFILVLAVADEQAKLAGEPAYA